MDLSNRDVLATLGNLDGKEAIELRHHSVSLNLNVRGLTQSATLAIKDRCRELRSRGTQVVDFGLGQSPFPVPTAVVEALREHAAEKDYLPVRGLPALREAVAQYHRRKDQIETDPNLVLVGPGSKELMFLLQLVFYGEINLRTPCWVSYLPQAKIIGRTITLIPTTFETGWKLTADLLERSLKKANDDARPRLLVMNYPMNPTGHTYSAQELQALADAARRFGLIVLSDEIYGPLHFSGEHTSIARFYPERTIVSSGLSKWCGAGGWRLGTFSFPAELAWLADAMAVAASETYTSVCAPVQYAAVRAFEYDAEIETYLQHVRRILAAVGRRCTHRLREAGIRLHEPEGAFYLFLDFTPLTERLDRRGIHEGATLCERLLTEAGVAILPGSAFARPAAELTARLSYVDFDGAAALAASRSIALDQDLPDGWIDRHVGNVLQGVERIVEWTARTG